MTKRTTKIRTNTFYKKWWFWAILTLALLLLGFYGIRSAGLLEKEKKPAQTSTEKTTKKETLDVNTELEELLRLNKGWASGTIDENGNDIENGTPADTYAIWTHVNSITYDGTNINVQVTADFNNFSEEEKNELSSNCQGAAMGYAEIETIPNIHFYVEENLIGESEESNAISYQWYY